MRRRISDYREPMSRSRLAIQGMIRRLTVAATDLIGQWSILGFIDFDENEEDDNEVEIFQGVGFVSRPPASANSEVIAAQVGGESNHLVIIASRDEDTRKANMADVLEDESAVYNSAVRLHLKADGTIEARTHGGAAVALALLSDVQGVIDAINGATTVATDGGASLQTTFGVAISSGGLPKGTTKLKGE